MKKEERIFGNCFSLSKKKKEEEENKTTTKNKTLNMKINFHHYFQ